MAAHVRTRVVAHPARGDHQNGELRRHVERPADHRVVRWKSVDGSGGCLMVTTRTLISLRTAEQLPFLERVASSAPDSPTLASVLLNDCWKADRYVRCLYTFEEECMKRGISSLGLPAALLSASLFAACQNTARGVEQDTERNTAEARQEARRPRESRKLAGNASEARSSRSRQRR